MEAVVYRGARTLEVESRVAGAIPPQQLISKILPVDEVDAAFGALEGGGGVRKILPDWRGSV